MTSPGRSASAARGTRARVQLDGEWSDGQDYVEAAGEGLHGLVVTNTARRVEARLSSAHGEALRVAVKEDGPPLDREWCGEDCAEDPDLGAATIVEEERWYEIVVRDDVETHELGFEADGPGLRVHGFRFS